ncbi:unnamed protein product [Arabidopsis thaliana]|uniref:(thale cress) hypothetical protein n=1 Tax=Arabidopsis thaliana TaxID=3702 RepID=A0A7G2E2Q7_ARATH|nr:unnamed protein product [Arabidopsis thaliana]
MLQPLAWSLICYMMGDWTKASSICFLKTVSSSLSRENSRANHIPLKAASARLQTRVDKEHSSSRFQISN